MDPNRCQEYPMVTVEIVGVYKWRYLSLPGSYPANAELVNSNNISRMKNEAKIHTIDFPDDFITIISLSSRRTFTR